MRHILDSRFGINETRWEAEEFAMLPDHEKHKTIVLPSDRPERIRLPSDEAAPFTPFPDRAL